MALLALALVAPGVVTARSALPSSTISAPGSPSVTFGNRKISVPSGQHFYGSQFGRMSANAGHVVVSSSSNLLVPPDDDIGPPGTYDLVAGRILKFDCHGLCPTSGVSWISNDGARYVGSTTVALVPEDTDGVSNTYLFDPDGPHLVTPGGITFLSILAVNPTATVVLFSTRTSLKPADTDTTADIYRWSKQTGLIDLVTPGVGAATFRALSDDGAKVLFETGENILGLDLGSTGNSAIYEWAGGTVGYRGRGDFVSVSADWTRIYMNTHVALVPSDVDGQRDGYVRDGTGFHILTPSTSQFAEAYVPKADGTKWLIISTEQLDPVNDTDVTSDTYIGSSGAPVLVTRGTQGANVWMNAAFTEALLQTSEALTAGDTDAGLTDVYRWKAATPTLPELVSAGMNEGHVSVLAFAPDGSRAFLSTLAQLIPADTDSFTDVYELIGSNLSLVFPGDQSYDVKGWSPDLKRVIAYAAALTAEDTNGNVFDVYISDADVTAPVVTVAAPAITSATPKIPFSSAGDDGAFFECKLDAGAWSRCGSPIALGPLGSGSHTLQVRAWDGAGNMGAGSDTWTVDATAPLTTGLTDQFLAGSTVSTGGSISMKYTWAGSDSGSGIGHHEIALSTDGGGYVTLSSNVATGSYTKALLKGHTYRARVRTVDAVGNVGNWVVGRSVKINSYQESSTSFTRTGTWTRVEHASAWAGAQRYASGAEAKLRMTFGGTSFAMVGRVGPNEGSAKVYVNGVYLKTISLYATSPAYRRVVLSLTWTTDAVRTVEIRVVGTAGHPRVYVDALVIGT